MAVVLQLIGSGVDGSTTFTDTSPAAKTVTGHGNAQIDTNTILLDGNGDYLDTSSALTDFAFGTGDFTIEFRAKKSAGGVNGFDIVLSTYSTGTASDGYWIELSGDRGLFFGGTSGGGGGSIAYANYNTGSFVDGVDHHWAVCRSGTSLKLFKDGTTVTAVSHSVNLPAALFKVGTDFYSEDFNGRIHDLRINKGTALYTADFTPPASPLPFTQTGQATGFLATNFGTPNFPFPQTGSATGFLATNFGAPRLVTLTSAAGFLATNFGTPYQVPRAIGFLATHFGIPSLSLVAVGFYHTNFGTPLGFSRFLARSLGVITHFGTPTTPTDRSFSAHGWNAVRLGVPTVVPFVPADLTQRTLASGLQAIHFGTPALASSVTTDAVGFLAAHFGTPRSHFALHGSATAIAPATAFGTPSAQQVAHAQGWQAARFGSPGSARAQQASSIAPRTRFGTPSYTRGPGTHFARTLGLRSRFGQPRGFNCTFTVANGFLPTHFGVPAAFDHHHVSALAPNTRFGTPLLLRSTEC